MSWLPGFIAASMIGRNLENEKESVDTTNHKPEPRKYRVFFKINDSSAVSIDVTGCNDPVSALNFVLSNNQAFKNWCDRSGNSIEIRRLIF